jgi:hypothetical protein
MARKFLERPYGPGLKPTHDRHLVIKKYVDGGYSVTRTTTRSTTTATIDTSAYQWNGDTDSAGFTFTLPAGVQGTQYRIVNVGTSGNTLTVSPAGTENLIGENSDFDLSDGESLIIGYDATDGWY